MAAPGITSASVPGSPKSEKTTTPINGPIATPSVPPVT